jgi:aspartate/methionine/tyrosine aminotransferase
VRNDTLRPYLQHTNAMYAAAAKRTMMAIERELGLPALEPQGGLYTCVKVGTDGGEFVTEALQNAAVLTVPGWGFGRTVRHAIRVSFGPLVNDLDRIDVGFARLGAFLRGKAAPAAERSRAVATATGAG